MKPIDMECVPGSALDIELKAEQSQPNVGYMLITHEIMQDSFDVVADHFEIVKDRTTWDDELNGYHRIVMRSPHFTNGYGKYMATFVGCVDGSARLSDVTFIGK